MQAKGPRDYQTFSLFLILGVLTLVLVFIMKVVLFSPSPLLEMATKL